MSHVRGGEEVEGGGEGGEEGGGGTAREADEVAAVAWEPTSSASLLEHQHQS